MRDYEVVYIFHPSLESEDVEEKLAGYHDRLDGEITAVEHWGQRQLAYEIQDERKGYYVVAQFRVEPASLSSFEQALRHDEELMRHLIVLSEGELPTPPSRRRREDEEEDEEPAEDEEEAEDGDEADGDEDDEEEEEEAEDEDEEDEADEADEADEDAGEDEADDDEADEADEADEDADEDEASDDEEK
jgi:small subunit ribosomal protein S6